MRLGGAHGLFVLIEIRLGHAAVAVFFVSMVPNINGTIGHTIKTRKHPKHGTQCVIQYPTNRNPAQSLQENALIVFGPRLYNSLPKYLRDIESVKTEIFKFELDKFLYTIPDQLKMPNYVTALGSNSILDQLIHLRAKEFTTILKSPTRPWSSLSCFEATPSIQVWLGPAEWPFSLMRGRGQGCPSSLK